MKENILLHRSNQIKENLLCLSKTAFVFFIILSFSQQVNAQQRSLNTLYNQNLYMINPAAAGQSGCISAFINYRNQWVGINNSPQRSLLTVDGRIKGHGLGLDIRMSKAGLLSDFIGKLTYAYHIKLNKKAYLSAGISAGIIQQRFLFSDAIATDYSDNLLGQGNQSDLGFSSDIGIMFYTKRLKIGVSSPQVFARGIGVDLNNGEQKYNLVSHLTGVVSYDVISSDKWQLTPSVLYRSAGFKGHQIDGSLRLGWKNIVGISFMYRSAYGFAGIFDLNLFKKIKVAYSYGFGGRNITNVSNGSHEVMLGFRFCQKPKEKIVDVVEEIPPVEIEEVDPVVEIVEVDSTPVEIPEPRKIDIDSLNAKYNVENRMIRFKLNSGKDITNLSHEKTLKDVSDILIKHRELNVILEGHTCNIGTEENNLKISKNRAEYIKQKLIDFGIDAGHIVTEPKGESEPLNDNSNESQRSKNRRVRIIFSR